MVGLLGNVAHLVIQAAGGTLSVWLAIPSLGLYGLMYWYWKVVRDVFRVTGYINRPVLPFEWFTLVILWAVWIWLWTT